MSGNGAFVAIRGNFLKNPVVAVDDHHMGLSNKSYRIANALIASLLCVTSTGCLALGLPSQRFHDAQDQGGILGDFRHSKTPGPPGMTEDLLTAGAVLVPPHASCATGTSSVNEQTVMASGVDPMDVHPVTGSCLAPVEESPKVPWPRFHPVPTRPVFGAPTY